MMGLDRNNFLNFSNIRLLIAHVRGLYAYSY